MPVEGGRRRGQGRSRYTGARHDMETFLHENTVTVNETVSLCNTRTMLSVLSICRAPYSNSPYVKFYLFCTNFSYSYGFHFSGVCIP